MSGRAGSGPRLRAAAAAYVGMALAATWPLPLKASSFCWGIRYDLWANLWLMGYFYRCLRTGSLHFTTHLVFYPRGFSLWAYGHFVLQILAAPLLAVMSPPVAYAVLIWTSLAGSALALYVLARDQTGSRWAGFVAGGLYSFHGLQYAELAVGSVEQAATFGLPIFILCLIRWKERGGWRWGLATYAAIMLAATCNWFFGIALASFTVLYVTFHLIHRRDGRLHLDRRLLGQALLLAVVCRVSVQPFFSAIMPQILDRPPLSAALLQEFQPPARAPVGEHDDLPRFLSQVRPAVVARLALRQTVADSVPVDRLLSEDMTTLPRLAGPGFEIVLLAALGCLLGGRRARFWLFAAVLLTVVSLGPFLRVSEFSPPRPIPLPYYFIYNAVPIFRVAYRAYRFQSTALVAASVLAAFGVAAILAGIPEPRRRGAAAVAILGIGLLVRWVLCTPDRTPLLSDARVPGFYADLAREPGRFGIVEIPIHHWTFGDSNARFNYYQIFHGKGMLNNSNFINMQQLLRLRRLVRAHPLLLALCEGIYSRRMKPPPSFARDVAWMRQVGFRYVVVHTTFPRDVFHATGHQETKSMIGEPFIDFLERSFGAPRATPDALLFDVRRDGPGGKAATGVQLDFLGDYARTEGTLTLQSDQPLRWRVSVARPQRVAFWAMAEPGTAGLQVTLTGRDAAGRPAVIRHDAPLSTEQWTRVAIPCGMARLDTVAVGPIDPAPATVDVSHVQVLRRTARSGRAALPAP